MASVMIGRTACHECGFDNAHVKKTDKCTYRYCPECGSQHHAKTTRQVDDLLKKTRLIETPSGTGPTPTPTDEKKPGTAPQNNPTPTPSGTDGPSVSAPPAKRRGLFA